jgi:hypothetical protein
MKKPGAAKPARLEVIASNIPQVLCSLRRWVVWSWRLRNGKWDKPPLQVDGAFASVDDPGTWCSFAEALAAHQAGKFDGIGFVLGYVAEQDVTYAGVDFDECRDLQTGEVQDWAAAHLDALDTYAETSPSGEGVKALAIGTLPGPDRNESQRLGVEMYRGGRYFTVTGHRLANAPPEIRERTAELADLYYLIFGSDSKPGQSVPCHDRPDDRALALSALDGLSPSLADCYWDWLRVGMALHAIGDDGEMFSAWDRWSQHCVEKYQPGACGRKWKSFGKKGGLGLGSLIFWAKQNGWTFPQSRPKVESSARADAGILGRLDSVLAAGAEALFRDREIVEALARLAETDPPEFACVRAKVQKARVSLRDLDASIAPFRQAIRAARPPRESAGSYRVVAGRIVNLRTTREGPIEVPLCNFTARISEVVTRDDGVEQAAMFAIEGQLADGRPLARLQVPAADFQRLEWVTTGWHGEAVIYAGSGTRDHTRCAIELLSPDRARRVQYLHTGWRELGGQWVYIHAGGAIGKDGSVTGVEVDLAGTLGRVSIPGPPTGADLVRAVRASLALLSLASDRITAPVLAAIYRAPLGDMDFAQHLCGPSGVFKTELAALAQGHYGLALDARCLPGSWSSTENALEELAFAAKDMLLVIDDFKPRGSSYDVQSYHGKADRLFRAVGNHSGRQRLTRERKLRPDRRPRGLVLSTGEEIPQGESLRARMLVAEIGPGDIDCNRLTQCQRDAAAGLYAAAMSGYLRWLAGRYTAVRSGLKQQRDKLRDQARSELTKGHARSSGIAADLALGLKHFFEFAVALGAITEEERSTLAKQCWAALLDAVAAQAEHVEAAEPATKFFQLLAAALASGRAHLAGPEGNEPVDPSAWGWRRVEVGTGEHARTEWRPQGRRVGWVDWGMAGMTGAGDAEQVYLEPDASFAEVQQLAHVQGEPLTISPRTLRRRLKERGLLASTDPGREVLTVRRVLEGRRRDVLHVRGLLLHKQPDQPDHRGTSAQTTASFSGREGENGRSHPTIHPTTDRHEPDQSTRPTTTPTTGSSCPPSTNSKMVGSVGSETRGEGTPENNPPITDRETFEV